MLKINYHSFKTNKCNNIIIILLSDIHYDKDFNIELEDNIIEKVKNMNPDYICITGDIIDNASVINSDISNKLLLFLRELSEVSKVFIVLGSHDLENVQKPDNKFHTYLNKWKDLLKNEENIYLLDNDQYTDSNVNIIGITPPFSYYHEYPNENVDIIIDELNKNKYKLNDKYNLLLIHSPRRILTNKSINNIKLLEKIDLILSGHMHNGVMPKFLMKLPTSIGLISPDKKLFPKYARGVINKKIKDQECHLVITGGITKISPALPSYIKRLKVFYNNEIECINIRSKHE